MEQLNRLVDELVPRSYVNHSGGEEGVRQFKTCRSEKPTLHQRRRSLLDFDDELVFEIFSFNIRKILVCIILKFCLVGEIRLD